MDNCCCCWQMRSKRDFQRIQRSDTVKLVYPPRVFRVELMSDPVKCEHMSQVPHKVHRHQIEGNLPVARRLSSIRRSATFMEPPSPYAMRTRRTSAQMPSYIAPAATPSWSRTPLDNEQDDQPPHPPTRPVVDSDMI